MYSVLLVLTIAICTTEGLKEWVSQLINSYHNWVANCMKLYIQANQLAFNCITPLM